MPKEKKVKLLGILIHIQNYLVLQILILTLAKISITNVQNLKCCFVLQ